MFKDLTPKKQLCKITFKIIHEMQKIPEIIKTIQIIPDRFDHFQEKPKPTCTEWIEKITTKKTK